ncbi:cytochrome P450 oxidoreductase, partial [Fusarium albosuccineum]
LWTPGFDAIRSRAASDEVVREDLRTLLGLTISNPNLPTAYFTAHHTLYACGVYLKDEREHREVFRFLEAMSKSMGWPTREVAAQLRKDWSMEKRNSSPSPHQALVAHRDESIYHEADKFIPERFLGDKGKELQSYLITFSAGARGCIGRNISYLEQAVLLASVVHRYEFALPAGFELKRLETMNHILGEMPVKVWRRNLGEEE